jgi:chorismate-pyruvate lyase
MFEVRRILLGCVTMLLSLSVHADQPTLVKPSSTWTDSFITRLEALALLQSLNAELLSNNSATLTLEHWCEVHHLASPARILAERVRDIDKPVSAQLRTELGVTLTEAVRYRRVQLRCGAVVLSTADNWYVPSRLTSEMNAVLDGTDTPFGKAVQALHFQRHTLSSKILWWPLPEGWEVNANGAKHWGMSSMPAKLLEHKAVLTLPDGTPLSEVVETYTDNVLGFPVPTAE